MRTRLYKIRCFFVWLFYLVTNKKIKTVEKAKAMSLVHYTNIHGDGINMTGCRSFWTDVNGRVYGCDQLLDEGADVVMDPMIAELKKHRPEIFKTQQI